MKLKKAEEEIAD
jgi:hypothetical protein